MKVVRRDPNKVYLSNMLWVPKALINADAVKRALVIDGESKHGVRVETLYQETNSHLLVPRRFYPLDNFEQIVDCRPKDFPTINVKSRIILDAKNPAGTLQRDAMQALLHAEGGILQLACGHGKTPIALDFLARRAVPAVIAVDNENLLGQWEQEIQRFLDLPDGYSIVRGKKGDWGAPVVLTTYQTLALYANKLSESVRRRFGTFIGDEGHHLPATTFSRACALFYGYRLALTATPTRTDGFHVILDHHFGPVLYKNLKQELVPRIVFLWTGFSLDENNRAMMGEVSDYRNELHLGKLASYFGRWRARLEFVIGRIREAHQQGRRILVLSNSVEELIGMLALWVGSPLFCEAQESNVTPQDVGETVLSHRLPELELAKLEKRLIVERRLAAAARANPVRAHQAATLVATIERRLAEHACWQKIQNERDKRLRQYARTLMQQGVGLLIGGMSTSERTQQLQARVVFAISKYGQEGLDSPNLDTIFACESMSQKNGLQQFMGRVLRKTSWTKDPLVVFFEDDIAPLRAMCEILRRHLREWPVEEGGPFSYIFFNNPFRKSSNRWL